MSRLFGLTVAKNEANRYLRPMMASIMEVVDAHFFYDDQSDDGTPDIAYDFGATVAIRDNDTPSFLEHEGRFRQAAWDLFVQTMTPRLSDWVIAIDADEFLVTTDECCVRCDIDNAIKRAGGIGARSVILPVEEVFGFKDGTPLIRKDGFWGQIRGTRLFNYAPKGVFDDKPMGCDAEPNYVKAWGKSPVPFGLHIMHYGYARAEDQQTKYERYSKLVDHGHNDAHIQSILARPTLQAWSGPVPWVPE